jgi:hypothetical protein
MVVDSLTHFCSYSETILPTPAELVGAEFVVERDAYQGIGRDTNYSCLKHMGSIEHMILGNEASQTVTSWYKAQGVDIARLRNGTRFQLLHFVALVKHGFGTIDAGKGPTYFLVLKDASGALYYVVSMGNNLDDRFLSMKLPNAEPILVNHRNFDTSSDVNHPGVQFRKIESVK